MRDVAHAAGVSLAAVSLAATGRPGIGEDTRARILDVMRQLDYHPRQVGYRARPTVTIAVVNARLMETSESEFPSMEILQGIQSEAQLHGHPVLLRLVEGNTTMLGATEGRTGPAAVGIVLAGGGNMQEQTVERLASSTIPTVLVGTAVGSLPLHAVMADDFGAGYIATRHLLRLGHRRIGLLAAPPSRGFMERRRGYIAALTEQDIPVNRVIMAPPNRPLSTQLGYDEMVRLLAQPVPPTAVVAISDMLAFGAMTALKECGATIPNDMALVGIGNRAESIRTIPALTSVRVPWFEMGQEAVRRVLYLLHHDVPCPTRTILYTHLVVRQSCGI